MDPKSHCGNWGAPSRVLSSGKNFRAPFGKRIRWPHPVPTCAPVWREPVRPHEALLATPGQVGGGKAELSSLWPVVFSQQPSMSFHLPVCPGTGRGKDTLTGGEEDSSTRTAARPSLAQCRALSVDWPGPRSPHRLYLTVQVSVGHQM